MCVSTRTPEVEICGILSMVSVSVCTSDAVFGMAMHVADWSVVIGYARCDCDF